MSAEVISRDPYRVVFHCATCSETFDTDDLPSGAEVDDFREAWSHAQAAGWVAFMDGGTTRAGTPSFSHYCESCARR